MHGPVALKPRSGSVAAAGGGIGRGACVVYFCSIEVRRHHRLRVVLHDPARRPRRELRRAWHRHHHEDEEERPRPGWPRHLT